MDRGQRGIIIRFWLITVLCLVLFVSWMVCLYAKNEATYIVMQNIMVFSYAILGVVLVVLFHEDYWMVTSGFLLVSAILEIGKLYFLTYKLYNALAFILLILSLIYLLICMIWAWKDRLYKTFHLTNGFVPILYIALFGLLNWLDLAGRIHTEMGAPSVLIGVGLAIAITATIFASVLSKNRENRKEYIGSLIGVCFLSLFLAVGLPIMCVVHVNYAFDTSTGVQTEYTVLEKRVSVSSGRYSSTNFDLLLEVDGQKIEFRVSRMVFEKYQEGETICLYAHEGALHYPYLEYRMESIYKYRET